MSQPTRAAVVTAMGIWFSYVGVTNEEMLDVSGPLLQGATRPAHAAANPALQLFIEAVEDLGLRGRHPAPGTVPLALAEVVANALRDDIERAGWPVGEVVGSENELIARHGVSRAVLREAVRILEHHGAVRTKRGPQGGVVVSIPDSGAIVRSAHLFLEYEGVTAAQLFEARSIIEVAAVRLAAERAGLEQAGGLRAALDEEQRRGDAAAHFMAVHHRIADATDNRVFALFVDVMGELVPSHISEERRTPEGMRSLSVDVHKAHARIVDAIVAGDADLAERRMRRHLSASVDVLD